MVNWYCVEVFRAHRGAGKYESTACYVYADGVSEVFQRQKQMPGIKRNNPRFMPRVKLLSEEQGRELEKIIIQEGRISVEKARRTWYYPNN